MFPAKYLINKGHNVKIICLSDKEHLTYKDDINVIRINRSSPIIFRWLKTIVKIYSNSKKSDLIFVNGLSFAMTSLAVIAIPLIGILFSKRQWMFSKKFGFVTPSEMLGTYFKSDIIRVLIVIITLGFSIPILFAKSTEFLRICILVSNLGSTFKAPSVMIKGLSFFSRVMCHT